MLLVGDVVTNFVAKFDDVSKAVTAIQQKLEGLAKQTFNVKLGADESKVVRAVQRIDVNLAKVRSTLDRLSRAFTSITDATVKQVVKASDTVAGTFGRAAANGRQSLQKIKTETVGAATFISTAVRNATQAFLDWTGAFTLAAVAVVPNFVRIVTQATGAAKDTAGAVGELKNAVFALAPGLETVTNNLSYALKTIEGSLVAVSVVAAAAIAAVSPLTAVLTGLGVAGVVAALNFEQVTASVQQFGAESNVILQMVGGWFGNLGESVEFLGSMVTSVVRTITFGLVDLDLPLSTLIERLTFGRIQLASVKDIFFGILPAFSAVGVLALSVQGVAFGFRSVLGHIRRIADERPDTVLGRMASLINTMFVAINSVVSPMTIIVNRASSLLAIVTTLTGAVIAVTVGVSTLFIGIQSIFGLVSIAMPLVTNLIARTQIAATRVAAILGSSRARFLLFFNEIKDAFGTVAVEFNRLRQQFGRRFNFVAFIVQSFNSIRESVQFLAHAGASLLSLTVDGARNTLSMAGNVAAITMNIDRWPAVFKDAASFTTDIGTNMMRQRSIIERIVGFLSTFSSSFFETTSNVLRNALVTPFLLLREGAVNTFNYLKVVILGFSKKAKESIVGQIGGAFFKALPSSIQNFFGVFRRVFQTVLAPFTTKTSELGKKISSIWAPDKKALDSQFKEAGKRVTELDKERQKASDHREQSIAKESAKLAEVNAQMKVLADEEKVATEKRKTALEAVTSELHKQKTAYDAVRSSLPKHEEAAKETKARLDALKFEQQQINTLAKSRQGTSQTAITAAERLKSLSSTSIKELNDLLVKKAQLAALEVKQADAQARATQLAVRAAEAENELNDLRQRRAAPWQLQKAQARLVAEEQELQKLQRAYVTVSEKVRIARADVSEFEAVLSQGHNMKRLAQEAKPAMDALVAAAEKEHNAAVRQQQVLENKKDLHSLVIARLQKEVAEAQRALDKEQAVFARRKQMLEADAQGVKAAVDSNIAQINKETDARLAAIAREQEALFSRRELLARQLAAGSRTLADIGVGTSPGLRQAARAVFSGLEEHAKQTTDAVRTEIEKTVQQVKTTTDEAVRSVFQTVRKEAGPVAVDVEKQFREAAAKVIAATPGLATRGRGGGEAAVRLKEAIAARDTLATIIATSHTSLQNLSKLTTGLFAQTATHFSREFIPNVARAMKEFDSTVSTGMTHFVAQLAEFRGRVDETANQIFKKVFAPNNVRVVAGATQTALRQGLVNLAVIFRTEGPQKMEEGLNTLLKSFIQGWDKLTPTVQAEVRAGVRAMWQPLADAMPSSPPKDQQAGPAKMLNGIPKLMDMTVQATQQGVAATAPKLKSLWRRLYRGMEERVPELVHLLRVGADGFNDLFSVASRFGRGMTKAWSAEWNDATLNLDKLNAGLRKGEKALQGWFERRAQAAERGDLAKNVINGITNALNKLNEAATKTRTLPFLIEPVVKTFTSAIDLFTGTAGALAGLTRAFTSFLTPLPLVAGAVGAAFFGPTGLLTAFFILSRERRAEVIRGIGQAVVGLTRSLSGFVKIGAAVTKTIMQVTKLTGALIGGAFGLLFGYGSRRVQPTAKLFGGSTSLHQFEKSGAEIVNRIGKGMNSAKAYPAKEMEKIAQSLADYLPQSPPLRGPLAGNFLTDAGAKIIDMVSFGILKQGGVLNRAVSTVLTAAFMPIFGPTSLIVSGATALIDLIKNVGFTLTNLSNNPAIATLKKTSDEIVEIGLAAERFAPSDAKVDEFTRKYDAFAKAVKPLGLEASRIETIFVTLERSLSEAVANPLGEAAAKFQRLGVDLTAFAQGEEDIIDVTTRLADQVASGTLAAEEFQEAFELTAATFGPLKNLLLRGGQQIRKSMEEAKEVGVLIDQDAVNSAIEFNKKLHEVEVAIQGIKRTIFTELIPPLVERLKFVESWWKTNKAAIIEGVSLIAQIVTALVDIVIKKIGDWIATPQRFLDDLVSVVVFVFSTAFALFNKFLAKLPEIAVIAGRTIQQILPFLETAAQYIIRVIFPKIGAALIRTFSTAFAEFLPEIEQFFSQMGTELQRRLHLVGLADDPKKRLKELQEQERAYRALVADAEKQLETLAAGAQRDYVENLLKANRQRVSDLMKAEQEEYVRLGAIKRSADDVKKGFESVADTIERTSTVAARELGPELEANIKVAVKGAAKEAAKLGELAIQSLQEVAPELAEKLKKLTAELGIEQPAADIEDKLRRLSELISEAKATVTTDAEREQIELFEESLNTIAKSFQINMALLIGFSKKVEELRRKASEILGFEFLDLTDLRREREIALAEIDHEISKLTETQADLIRQRDLLMGEALTAESTDAWLEALDSIDKLTKAIGENEVALTGLNEQLALTKKLADQSDNVHTLEKLAQAFTTTDSKLGELIGKQIEYNKEQIELAQNLSIVQQKVAGELAAGIDGPVVQALDLFRDRALAVGGEVADEIAIIYEQFLIEKAAGQIELAAQSAAELFKRAREIGIKTAQEEEDGKFDALAEGLGNAIKETLSSAVTEFSENQGKVKFGRLFNNLFKSISDSMLNILVNDLTKNLVESLKTGFKDVFKFAGEQAGTLATVATAAVAIALQFLSSQSRQELAVAKEGLQDVVEETERVRGIISGESTIKLKEVADSLLDALLPTNDILRRIEFNTRVGLAAANAAPLAQQVGGI